MTTCEEPTVPSPLSCVPLLLKHMCEVTPNLRMISSISRRKDQAARLLGGAVVRLF